ncbi:hypothetical protein ACFLQ1_01315, partial [Candidatus Auribacterota bacterium]
KVLIFDDSGDRIRYVDSDRNAIDIATLDCDTDFYIDYYDYEGADLVTAQKSSTDGKIYIELDSTENPDIFNQLFEVSAGYTFYTENRTINFYDLTTGRYDGDLTGKGNTLLNDPAYAKFNAELYSYMEQMEYAVGRDDSCDFHGTQLIYSLMDNSIVEEEYIDDLETDIEFMVNGIVVTKDDLGNYIPVDGSNKIYRGVGEYTLTETPEEILNLFESSKGALNYGKSINYDYYGGETRGFTTQVYDLIKGGTKVLTSLNLSETDSADLGTNASLSMTKNNYDNMGTLISAEGGQVNKSKDFWDNVTTGRTNQYYEVIAGQAKVVSSNSDSATNNANGGTSSSTSTSTNFYDFDTGLVDVTERFIDDEGRGIGSQKMDELRTADAGAKILVHDELEVYVIKDSYGVFHKVVDYAYNDSANNYEIDGQAVKFYDSDGLELADVSGYTGIMSVVSDETGLKSDLYGSLGEIFYQKNLFRIYTTKGAFGVNYSYSNDIFGNASNTKAVSEYLVINNQTKVKQNITESFSYPKEGSITESVSITESFYDAQTGRVYDSILGGGSSDIVPSIDFNEIALELTRIYQAHYQYSDWNLAEKSQEINELIAEAIDSFKNAEGSISYSTSLTKAINKSVTLGAAYQKQDVIASTGQTKQALSSTMSYVTNLDESTSYSKTNTIYEYDSLGFALTADGNGETKTGSKLGDWSEGTTETNYILIGAKEDKYGTYHFRELAVKESISRTDSTTWSGGTSYSRSNQISAYKGEQATLNALEYVNDYDYKKQSAVNTTYDDPEDVRDGHILAQLDTSWSEGFSLSYDSGTISRSETRNSYEVINNEAKLVEALNTSNSVNLLENFGYQVKGIPAALTIQDKINAGELIAIGENHWFDESAGIMYYKNIDDGVLRYDINPQMDETIDSYGSESAFWAALSKDAVSANDNFGSFGDGNSFWKDIWNGTGITQGPQGMGVSYAFSNTTYTNDPTIGKPQNAIGHSINASKDVYGNETSGSVETSYVMVNNEAKVDTSISTTDSYNRDGSTTRSVSTTKSDYYRTEAEVREAIAAGNSTAFFGGLKGQVGTTQTIASAKAGKIMNTTGIQIFEIIHNQARLKKNITESTTYDLAKDDFFSLSINLEEYTNALTNGDMVSVSSIDSLVYGKDQGDRIVMGIDGPVSGKYTVFYTDGSTETNVTKDGDGNYFRSGGALLIDVSNIETYYAGSITYDVKEDDNKDIVEGTISFSKPETAYLVLPQKKVITLTDGGEIVIEGRNVQKTLWSSNESVNLTFDNSLGFTEFADDVSGNRYIYQFIDGMVPGLDEFKNYSVGVQSSDSAKTIKHFRDNLHYESIDNVSYSVSNTANSYTVKDESGNRVKEITDNGDGTFNIDYLDNQVVLDLTNVSRVYDESEAILEFNGDRNFYFTNLDNISEVGQIEHTYTAGNPGDMAADQSVSYSRTIDYTGSRTQAQTTDTYDIQEGSLGRKEALIYKSQNQNATYHYSLTEIAMIDDSSPPVGISSIVENVDGTYTIMYASDDVDLIHATKQGDYTYTTSIDTSKGGGEIKSLDGSIIEWMDGRRWLYASDEGGGTYSTIVDGDGEGGEIKVTGPDGDGFYTIEQTDGTTLIYPTEKTFVYDNDSTPPHPAEWEQYDGKKYYSTLVDQDGKEFVSLPTGPDADGFYTVEWVDGTTWNYAQGAAGAYHSTVDSSNGLELKITDSEDGLYRIDWTGGTPAAWIYAKDADDGNYTTTFANTGGVLEEIKVTDLLDGFYELTWADGSPAEWEHASSDGLGNYTTIFDGEYQEIKNINDSINSGFCRLEWTNGEVWENATNDGGGNYTHTVDEDLNELLGLPVNNGDDSYTVTWANGTIWQEASKSGATYSSVVSDDGREIENGGITDGDGDGFYTIAWADGSSWQAAVNNGDGSYTTIRDTSDASELEIIDSTDYSGFCELTSLINPEGVLKHVTKHADGVYTTLLDSTYFEIEAVTYVEADDSYNIDYVDADKESINITAAAYDSFVQQFTINTQSETIQTSTKMVTAVQETIQATTSTLNTVNEVLETEDRYIGINERQIFPETKSVTIENKTINVSTGNPIDIYGINPPDGALVTNKGDTTTINYYNTVNDLIKGNIKGFTEIGRLADRLLLAADNGSVHEVASIAIQEGLENLILKDAIKERDLLFQAIATYDMTSKSSYAVHFNSANNLIPPEDPAESVMEQLLYDYLVSSACINRSLVEGLILARGIEAGLGSDGYALYPSAAELLVPMINPKPGTNTTPELKSRAEAMMREQILGAARYAGFYEKDSDKWEKYADKVIEEINNDNTWADYSATMDTTKTNECLNKVNFICGYDVMETILLDSGMDVTGHKDPPANVGVDSLSIKISEQLTNLFIHKEQAKTDALTAEVLNIGNLADLKKYEANKGDYVRAFYPGYVIEEASAVRTAIETAVNSVIDNDYGSVYSTYPDKRSGDYPDTWQKDYAKEYYFNLIDSVHYTEGSYTTGYSENYGAVYYDPYTSNIDADPPRVKFYSSEDLSITEVHQKYVIIDGESKLANTVNKSLSFTTADDGEVPAYADPESSSSNYILKTTALGTPMMQFNIVDADQTKSTRNGVAAAAAFLGLGIEAENGDNTLAAAQYSSYNFTTDETVYFYDLVGGGKLDMSWGKSNSLNRSNSAFNVSETKTLYVVINGEAKTTQTQTKTTNQQIKKGVIVGQSLSSDQTVYLYDAEGAYRSFQASDLSMLSANFTDKQKEFLLGTAYIDYDQVFDSNGNYVAPNVAAIPTTGDDVPSYGQFSVSETVSWGDDADNMYRKISTSLSLQKYKDPKSTPYSYGNKPILDKALNITHNIDTPQGMSRSYAPIVVSEIASKYDAVAAQEGDDNGKDEGIEMTQYKIGWYPDVNGDDIVDFPKLDVDMATICSPRFLKGEDGSFSEAYFHFYTGTVNESFEGSEEERRIELAGKYYNNGANYYEDSFQDDYGSDQITTSETTVTYEYATDDGINFEMSGAVGEGIKHGGDNWNDYNKDTTSVYYNDISGYSWQHSGGTWSEDDVFIEYIEDEGKTEEDLIEMYGGKVYVEERVLTDDSIAGKEVYSVVKRKSHADCDVQVEDVLDGELDGKGILKITRTIPPGSGFELHSFTETIWDTSLHTDKAWGHRNAWDERVKQRDQGIICERYMIVRGKALVAQSFDKLLATATQGKVWAITGYNDNLDGTPAVYSWIGKNLRKTTETFTTTAYDSYGNAINGTYFDELSGRGFGGEYLYPSKEWLGLLSPLKFSNGTVVEHVPGSDSDEYIPLEGITMLEGTSAKAIEARETYYPFGRYASEQYSISYGQGYDDRTTINSQVDQGGVYKNQDAFLLGDRNFDLPTYTARFEIADTDGDTIAIKAEVNKDGNISKVTFDDDVDNNDEDACGEVEDLADDIKDLIMWQPIEILADVASVVKAFMDPSDQSYNSDFIAAENTKIQPRPSALINPTGIPINGGLDLNININLSGAISTSVYEEETYDKVIDLNVLTLSQAEKLAKKVVSYSDPDFWSDELKTAGKLELKVYEPFTTSVLFDITDNKTRMRYSADHTHTVWDGPERPVNKNGWATFWSVVAICTGIGAIVLAVGWVITGEFNWLGQHIVAATDEIISVFFWPASLVSLVITGIFCDEAMGVGQLMIGEQEYIETEQARKESWTSTTTEKFYDELGRIQEIISFTDTRTIDETKAFTDSYSHSLTKSVTKYKGSKKKLISSTELGSFSMSKGTTWYDSEAFQTFLTVGRIVISIALCFTGYGVVVALALNIAVQTAVMLIDMQLAKESGSLQYYAKRDGFLKQWVMMAAIQIAMFGAGQLLSSAKAAGGDKLLEKGIEKVAEKAAEETVELTTEELIKQGSEKALEKAIEEGASEATQESIKIATKQALAEAAGQAGFFSVQLVSVSLGEVVAKTLYRVAVDFIKKKITQYARKKAANSDEALFWDAFLPILFIAFDLTIGAKLEGMAADVGVGGQKMAAEAVSEDSSSSSSESSGRDAGPRRLKAGDTIKGTVTRGGKSETITLKVVDPGGGKALQLQTANGEVFTDFSSFSNGQLVNTTEGGFTLQANAGMTMVTAPGTNTIEVRAQGSTGQSGTGKGAAITLKAGDTITRTVATEGGGNKTITLKVEDVGTGGQQQLQLRNADGQAITSLDNVQIQSTADGGLSLQSTSDTTLVSQGLDSVAAIEITNVLDMKAEIAKVDLELTLVEAAVTVLMVAVEAIKQGMLYKEKKKIIDKFKKQDPDKAQWLEDNYGSGYVSYGGYGDGLYTNQQQFAMLNQALQETGSANDFQNFSTALDFAFMPVNQMLKTYKTFLGRMKGINKMRANVQQREGKLAQKAFAAYKKGFFGIGSIMQIRTLFKKIKMASIQRTINTLKRAFGTDIFGKDGRFDAQKFETRFKAGYKNLQGLNDPSLKKLGKSLDDACKNLQKMIPLLAQTMNTLRDSILSGGSMSDVDALLATSEFIGSYINAVVKTRDVAKKISDTIDKVKGFLGSTNLSGTEAGRKTQITKLNKNVVTAINAALKKPNSPLRKLLNAVGKQLNMELVNNDGTLNEANFMSAVNEGKLSFSTQMAIVTSSMMYMKHDVYTASGGTGNVTGNAMVKDLMGANGAFNAMFLASADVERETVDKKTGDKVKKKVKKTGFETLVENVAAALDTTNKHAGNAVSEYCTLNKVQANKANVAMQALNMFNDGLGKMMDKVGFVMANPALTKNAQGQYVSHLSKRKVKGYGARRKALRAKIKKVEVPLRARISKMSDGGNVERKSILKRINEGGPITKADLEALGFSPTDIRATDDLFVAEAELKNMSASSGRIARALNKRKYGPEVIGVGTVAGVKVTERSIQGFNQNMTKFIKALQSGEMQNPEKFMENLMSEAYVIFGKKLNFADYLKGPKSAEARLADALGVRSAADVLVGVDQRIDSKKARRVIAALEVAGVVLDGEMDTSLFEDSDPVDGDLTDAGKKTIIAALTANGAFTPTEAENIVDTVVACFQEAAADMKAVGPNSSQANLRNVFVSHQMFMRFDAIFNQSVAVQSTETKVKKYKKKLSKLKKGQSGVKKEIGELTSSRDEKADLLQGRLSTTNQSQGRLLAIGIKLQNKEALTDGDRTFLSEQATVLKQAKSGASGNDLANINLQIAAINSILSGPADAESAGNNLVEITLKRNFLPTDSQANGYLNDAKTIKVKQDALQAINEGSRILNRLSGRLDTAKSQLAGVIQDSERICNTIDPVNAGHFSGKSSLFAVNGKTLRRVRAINNVVGQGLGAVDLFIKVATLNPETAKTFKNIQGDMAAKLQSRGADPAVVGLLTSLSPLELARVVVGGWTGPKYGDEFMSPESPGTSLILGIGQSLAAIDHGSDAMLDAVEFSMLPNSTRMAWVNTFIDALANAPIAQSPRATLKSIRVINGQARVVIAREVKQNVKKQVRKQLTEANNNRRAGARKSPEDLEKEIETEIAKRINAIKAQVIQASSATVASQARSEVIQEFEEDGKPTSGEEFDNAVRKKTGERMAQLQAGQVETISASDFVAYNGQEGKAFDSGVKFITKAFNRLLNSAAVVFGTQGTLGVAMQAMVNGAADNIFKAIGGFTGAEGYNPILSLDFDSADLAIKEASASLRQGNSIMTRYGHRKAVAVLKSMRRTDPAASVTTTIGGVSYTLKADGDVSCKVGNKTIELGNLDTLLEDFDRMDAAVEAEDAFSPNFQSVMARSDALNQVVGIFVTLVNKMNEIKAITASTPSASMKKMGKDSLKKSKIMVKKLTLALGVLVAKYEGEGTGLGAVVKNLASGKLSSQELQNLTGDVTVITRVHSTLLSTYTSILSYVTPPKSTTIKDGAKLGNKINKMLGGKNLNMKKALRKAKKAADKIYGSVFKGGSLSMLSELPSSNGISSQVLGKIMEGYNEKFAAPLSKAMALAARKYEFAANVKNNLEPFYAENYEAFKNVFGSEVGKNKVEFIAWVINQGGARAVLKKLNDTVNRNGGLEVLAGMQTQRSTAIQNFGRLFTTNTLS